MKHIRALTLDLDDTLWEIHPVMRRAERALYDWTAEHYPRITSRFKPEDVRVIREQVVAEFHDRTHDLSFIRRTVLDRLRSAVGYEAGFVDAAFDVFNAVRNDVELFPEVIPALTILDRHFALVAVTNGNSDLGRIGIARYFDDVITAARAGAAKPARQVFEMAVQIAGYSAKETLHVGDHPRYDVEGARQAGQPTVWVNRGDASWPAALAEPDHEVTHIGELPTILGVR